MKKFKFNLEAVQKLRKRKVEEKIRELSLVVGEVNKLSNEIRENNLAIQKTVDRFINVIGAEIHYLRIVDNYIKLLNIKNEQLQEDIQAQNENLNNAIQKVIEARKEEEIIEILRKKKYQEYYDRMLRFERSEEDEANLRDVVEDKRGLHHERETEQVQKQIPIVPKLHKKKRVPQNEYEKVMEYYESLKRASGIK